LVKINQRRDAHPGREPRRATLASSGPNTQFMLQSAKQSYGCKLSALDGEIGHVTDFDFDDQEWVVRYVVADTGFWLAGHLVLLSPRAFEGFVQVGGRLTVNLTRQKIEDSPAIEAHKTVSRQFEEEYHRYYDWPSYWEAGGMWSAVGLGNEPPPHIPSAQEEDWRSLPKNTEDTHLRSTKALTGYRVHIGGESIGHVTDFMVDCKSWAICHIVIETGHLFSRKRIAVSPSDVASINYDESTLCVKLTKEAIRNATEYDTPVDPPLQTLNVVD